MEIIARYIAEILEVFLVQLEKEAFHNKKDLR